MADAQPGAAPLAAPTAIALDSGPLNLLCHPNEQWSEVRDIRAWLRAHLDAGVVVLLPEIADYELRRDLLRQGRAESVQRLDALASDLVYLPLDTATMRRAAEFWAIARQEGYPATADPALDADVILAAQAAAVGATVASENVRHLARFVPAAPWRQILSG